LLFGGPLIGGKRIKRSYHKLLLQADIDGNCQTKVPVPVKTELRFHYIVNKKYSSEMMSNMRA